MKYGIIRGMRSSEQIPYGVKDFKRIRLEDFYYVFSEDCVGKESLYNCDMVLYYLGCLVANGEAPKNLIDANIRSDWNKLGMILAALAAGTPVHFICYEFKGRELVRLEEVKVVVSASH